MRGEDLQGLNIEELQQLERMLESGLKCVMETKVLHIYMHLHSFALLILIFFSTNKIFSQSNRIMNEISSLENKVSPSKF